jgi:hypothetical protein
LIHVQSSRHISEKGSWAKVLSCLGHAIKVERGIPLCIAAISALRCNFLCCHPICGRLQYERAEARRHLSLAPLITQSETCDDGKRRLDTEDNKTRQDSFNSVTTTQQSPYSTFVTFDQCANRHKAWKGSLKIVSQIHNVTVTICHSHTLSYTQYRVVSTDP